MNGANPYLQWQYLIFLAPAAAAAFLLLLSSLRIGGHRGHHGGGMRHHSGIGGGGHHRGHLSGSAAKAGGHRGTGGSRPGRQHGDRSSDAARTPWAVGFLAALFGIGRAPAPLIAEMFCLCWGVTGFWANRSLLPSDRGLSLFQMLPSLGIALAGGLIGSRISAELLGRLLPKDETAVVSRGGLFGLTGTIVYGVTTGSGRIHVYDEYGTLHDETCRVPEGCPEIPKGQSARVVDIDTAGNLLVEEAPEPLRLR